MIRCASALANRFAAIIARRSRCPSCEVSTTLVQEVIQGYRFISRRPFRCRPAKISTRASSSSSTDATVFSRSTIRVACTPRRSPAHCPGCKEKPSSIAIDPDDEMLVLQTKLCSVELNRNTQTLEFIPGCPQRGESLFRFVGGFVIPFGDFIFVLLGLRCGVRLRGPFISLSFSKIDISNTSYPTLPSRLTPISFCAPPRTPWGAAG